MFEGFQASFCEQGSFLCGPQSAKCFCPDIFARAKERYMYCLSRKKLKHFPSHILRHADEYTSFLVFFSREAFLSGNLELAELAYLVNRKLNNFDCFYTREMPDVFHLEHPVGSVIGQASFGDFLVVYQGVAVGGDMKLRYPDLGSGVALFAKCSVISSSVIGSNCAIGAGVQIYAGAIPSNTAVSLRDGSQSCFSALSWSVKERFFKL